jgi:hypothetical protein
MGGRGDYRFFFWIQQIILHNSNILRGGHFAFSQSLLLQVIGQPADRSSNEKELERILTIAKQFKRMTSYGDGGSVARYVRDT